MCVQIYKSLKIKFFFSSLKPVMMQVSKPEKGQHIQLKIDRLSSGGGRGVGRYKNLVVFVPLTAPGDEVKVEITKVKKSFLEAKIVEFTQPSSNRLEPPCPVFESCGGCSLQMLNYSEQLKEKEGFLDFALKRLVEEETNFVREPIEPSPKKLRYRNRIQVHQKGQEIGFFKKQSHSLVSLEDCLITDKRITDTFKSLSKENTNRRVELALNKKGDVVQAEGKLGPKEALFAQVNTELNSILVDYVLKQAKSLGNMKSVFDLYSGSGNFSFPLAQIFPKASVTGVELSEASVEVAKKQSSVSNLTFHAKDVAVFLRDFLTQNSNKVDLVLLDPPRQGLSKEVVSALLAFKPKNIFYISCDLASATRDIELLKQGFVLKRAKAFDMFPQTDHLESFFHLALK